MTAMIDQTAAQVEILHRAQALKESNLAFFKTFHPAIYNQYGEHVLSTYKVSLIPENGQLDILKDGRSIYRNRPVAEAREEMADFEQHHGPGRFLKTVKPPFGGYTMPRFFHRSCAKLIEKAPISASEYRGYEIPDFYPMVMFFGAGASYHIDEFLEKYDVINALVLEPDEDLFACSLYTVDWQKICQPFVDEQHRNIHFIVGPIHDNHHLQAYVLRYLGSRCPIYPVSALYFNHNKRPEYNDLVEAINKDTNAFVSVWGFYDDELNQLNNTLHNIHLDIPVIKANTPEHAEVPIFIVGAGPSLDQRIEDIKAHQGEAIIVSCGTAIHSLYHYGIKPDLQIELESHMVTYKALKELNDDEWLASIPIIGPAQIPPRVFNLFDRRAVYFKGESVTNFLFGKPATAVNRGTPTCTNAALALFCHWGFKNIYLFGMDFGYRDIANHHAVGSVYAKTDDEDLQEGNEIARDAKMDVTSVDGKPMKTKPILYTAMRTCEVLARAYDDRGTILNCSNGTAMDGIDWVPLDKPIPMPEKETNKQAFLDRQFLDNEQVIAKDIINERLEILDHNLRELVNYIRQELDKMEPNLRSLTETVTTITLFMEQKIRPAIPAFYFNMRGSIWHLLYIGYSHALAAHTDNQKREWISTWRDEVKSILKKLPNHFESIVFKEFDLDSDSWTWRSATDPED